MKLLKKILRNEAGQALPMALILLILGGFLIVPMLSLMTTNLTANRQIDRANTEVYAADAGVEMIIWNLQYNQYDPQENPDGLKLPEDGQTISVPMETLNGKTVTAELSKPAGEPFKVTSTATSPDGHSTTIVCRANAQADYSWFFDAAITSAEDVTIKSGTVVSGDVVYGGELTLQGEITDGEAAQESSLADNWPSTDYLSNWYYDQVDELTPFPYDEITLSGDRANPTLIGPLYRDGDLTLKGNGWGRINGTIYVTEQFDVNPTGGCNVDLNGQTIFSAYDNNCSGDAIYLGPNANIVGSGCVIAVGNIKLQPHLGAGDKVIGIDDNFEYQGSEQQDTLLLTKFTADISGDVEFFRVMCSGSGEVKAAIYDANGADGGPGALLGISNEGEGTEVVSGVNDIPFAKTTINTGTYYWLAAIADSTIICKNTTTGTSLKKSATYESFTFTDYPTGFQSAAGTTYLFAAHTVPFVFIMSIECTSLLQPQGNIYGSIAGSTEVELKPNCTLTLTDVPATGLEFPGMMPGGGTGSTGTPPTVLSYTIQ